MSKNPSKNKPGNMIRIIAGKWRSRKLSFDSDVSSLRPTPDRVRETLFNWLQTKISGAHCLDLFAGSGALAFEACSRDAASVTAIDNSSRATKRLEENAILLSCNTININLANSMQWLAQGKSKTQFDIVFLDPPYKEKLLPECCRLLEAGNLLAPGGLIYLESDCPLDDIELPPSWAMLRSKKAGQVYFGVCERLIH